MSDISLTLRTRSSGHVTITATVTTNEVIERTFTRTIRVREETVASVDIAVKLYRAAADMMNEADRNARLF
uniref:Uncharacterized protein n=1 Tax=uncultured prokaryote TaxID=198431 RepID=A0A0H5QJV1_9ZZZZ|nr:hypothetical protein [uncultured prokaryote]